MTNLWFANESARPLVYALCRLRRPSVPALRTACARASSRFAASNGQRSGRECIFSANASVCSAKNARNDVHAVISDLSLVLPILCQCSEKGKALLHFNRPRRRVRRGRTKRAPSGTELRRAQCAKQAKRKSNEQRRLASGSVARRLLRIEERSSAK